VTNLALEVERVDFVSVLTQDIPRAKQFYGETLGLPLETDTEHDLEFKLGQVTLDVFAPASIGQPFAPSIAGIAIRVPDVSAGRAKLEAKGVEFDGDIVDTGVCHFAFFKDPDGNVLMLHRRYVPRAEATQA
jgi:catechol 2,3-dioxygenase-like lactoylglutathione lyase family enzyme